MTDILNIDKMQSTDVIEFKTFSTLKANIIHNSIYNELCEIIPPKWLKGDGLLKKDFNEKFFNGMSYERKTKDDFIKILHIYNRELIDEYEKYKESDKYRRFDKLVYTDAEVICNIFDNYDEYSDESEFTNPIIEYSIRRKLYDLGMPTYHNGEIELGKIFKDMKNYSLFDEDFDTIVKYYNELLLNEYLEWKEEENDDSIEREDIVEDGKSKIREYYEDDNKIQTLVNFIEDGNVYDLLSVDDALLDNISEEYVKELDILVEGLGEEYNKMSIEELRESVNDKVKGICDEMYEHMKYRTKDHIKECLNNCM